MSPEDYELIRDAFVEASTMGPSERSVYLTTLRAERPEVCREVESLLRHDTKRTLVEVDKSQPTTSIGAAAPTVAVATPTTPSTVRRFLVSRPFRSTGGRSIAALLALTTLTVIGAIWLQGLTQRTTNALVGETLDGFARVQVALVETWIENAKLRVRAWSRTEPVRDTVLKLLESAKDSTPEEMASSELLDVLESSIRSAASSGDIAESELDDIRFAVWNRERELVADWNRDPKFYARTESDSGAAALASVFRGDDAVYIPSKSAYTADYEFKRPPEVAITTPVYDDNGRIVAALLIGGMFQTGFEDALGRGRYGQSAETYAINRDGTLASDSRFKDQLRNMGLLDEDDLVATLKLRVTAPDQDLRGQTVDGQSESWPLTTAADAISRRESGISTEPYPDYRGVPVVGAWQWLPDYRFGIVTEIDANEAFKAVQDVETANRSAIALLTFALMCAIAATTLNWWKQRNTARRTRIGAYTLHEKIGEGGMGEVFRAEHELLSRPAAVKLLKSEISASPEMSARFEREVRLASSLESPHTIEIYDFGRTETHDGSKSQFFCAMALLRGLTLRQLIRTEGPLEPARAAYLMLQVCRSLGEAHQKGLVHRDIKPANIMVCERGGVPDHVVVLDFGLAKEQITTRNSDSNVTKTSMLLGTPEFIAPERIRHPNLIDPRSDLYAIGVVMYLLLTGESVFETTSELDTLEKTLYADPPPPSTRRPNAGISLAFDEIVLACLKKDPLERPETATELLDQLSILEFETPWTERRAREWWDCQPKL